MEQQQRARQVERLGILHGHTEEERRGIMLAMTIRLQMFARSAIARHRVARLKAVRDATRRNVSVRRLSHLNTRRNAHQRQPQTSVRNIVVVLTHAVLRWNELSRSLFLEDGASGNRGVLDRV